MSRARSARDAVVTGMGFCLPGHLRPTFSADDLWQVASRGDTCLTAKPMYYGFVNLTPEMFAERFPDIPEIFSRHYTAAHRFGLVSLAEACLDAGLEPRSAALAEAAILVGRGGIDANVDSYLSVMGADPEGTTPLEAMELFVAAEQAMTPSDVSLVQAALTCSTGPCFTVSCGCASSAVQLGQARRLIALGEVEVAAVTGVDVFSIGLIENVQQLLRGAQRTYDALRSDGMPKLVPSFESLMRPYDRRARSINHGEGSATLIVESRAHADRRGAQPHGQILATAMARDGLANPLAADETGAELVNAVRRCLGEKWRVSQIPYVHGGSDGNAVVTAFEAEAIRKLYGESCDLLMTSQEGIFGHNGSPSGCLGAAVTLLMLEHGEVCPTANCEEPADGLPFDPVPGATTRPLDFDYALSFNYQIGGVKHAMLLGSADAV
ncbi:beta-ketoacyl synthase N-terminal-like domain-containing protein [Streptomyces sp. 6N223]|uniref:beta-ketoacyl synthase N-terminal-like domain-containing protein n=1 Tax=Streptomyces sp. 6N223 TaxID=3457412 RepID=UPI003FD4383B